MSPNREFHFLVTACSRSLNKDYPTVPRFTGSIEPSQINKMERFAKQFNLLKAFTIFAKRFILNVWQGTEYASVISKPARAVRLKANKET